jgi:predicted transposase YdaD
VSKPFDATLKSLLEAGPRDWVALAGYPGREAEILDADVSTLTAASDKVLHVLDPSPWILDINFQSGPDASLPRRMNLYNAVLEDRHQLLVRSVAILLAPRAHLSVINGKYVREFQGEKPHVQFRYQVIRVWELPVQPLLADELATLPLVPISNVTEQELPGIVEEMQSQLGKELWTATYILMGTRYETALVDHLLRGVITMEESVTYQAILAEGMAKGKTEGLTEGLREGKRTTLLLQGSKLFREPSPEVKATVEAIDSVEKLDHLLLRLLDAESWDDLLKSARGGAGRRKRSP